MAKKEVLGELPPPAEVFVAPAAPRKRTPSELVQRREALAGAVEQVIDVLAGETSLDRELVSGVVWEHATALVKGGNYAVALRDYFSSRLAKVQVAL